tara:strand:- start:936 stop:1223 length:288 start_codon:yes stop_codon:yes gene_type:complete
MKQSRMFVALHGYIQGWAELQCAVLHMFHQSHTRECDHFELAVEQHAQAERRGIKADRKHTERDDDTLQIFQFRQKEIGSSVHKVCEGALHVYDV